MKKYRILTFVLLVCLYSFSNPDKISLNGTWKLTWSDGLMGFDLIEPFKSFDYYEDPGRYIDVNVPADINTELQRLGYAENPNYGLNALKMRWIGQQYYQYYKEFHVNKDDLNTNIDLVFEKLDLIADIYLNGKWIGRHENAFIPCRINIAGKIKKGTNKLVVAIESGHYHTAEKNISDYARGFLKIETTKWPWLRKPAYQYNWDWHPTLVNVGITEDVYLEHYEKAKILQVLPVVTTSDDLELADIDTKVFIECGKKPEDITVNAEIKETGQNVSRKVALQPGLNEIIVSHQIDKPLLWWPAGQGKQNLYTIEITCKKASVLIDKTTIETGIRKVEIDTRPHESQGEYFTIKINNRPVFCKGANWVPPDMVYSPYDRKKIETLLDYTIEANFNMLRIWGGGTYANKEFMQMCDEMGIMIWHDFMFTVPTIYPYDDKNFRKNVKEEITWITRELGSHPSLILWCGNNEKEAKYRRSFSQQVENNFADYALFHHDIPRIIYNEDPAKEYRPASPYSSLYNSPWAWHTGDSHPWKITLGKAGPNFWEYRNRMDRFASEGGVMGAAVLETMNRFLPKDQRHLRSASWNYHDNTFNLDDNMYSYKSIEYWIGKEAEKMPYEEYIYLSALLQAEGYSEYINNFRHRKFNSSGAIFWMYNDSWPATHSWAIVDYYLHKRPSFFSTKRAFAPVNTVIVEDVDSISVYGINDTPIIWTGQLITGIFYVNGDQKILDNKAVQIPANQSFIMSKFSKDTWKKAGLSKTGIFSLLEKESIPIAQNRLFY